MSPSTWPAQPPAVGDLDVVGLDTDFTNVFDGTGSYSNPDFPDAALPPPRISGPDGRLEPGAVLFMRSPKSVLCDHDFSVTL